MSMKISNDTIGNRNRDLPACSAVGGIMSMKNSNDIIGNRTRDLPTCSAVVAVVFHGQTGKLIL